LQKKQWEKSSEEFCFIPLGQIPVFCQKLNVRREDEKGKKGSFFKEFAKKSRNPCQDRC
jgi:hypothetical protein